ncbi:MAG TPA: diaminopimelate decarboxylase [Polyangiaceae bacterium]|nr:diaminopimelate decarboxylase [Polyangiaceae bacterium]
MSAFSPELLGEIASRYGTPVYVYDAAVVRRQLATLESFDRVRYAQKACPNVHLLRLLRSEGAVVDCVSLGELERALTAGFSPDPARHEIVFTADILTEAVLARIVETGVPMNAGSSDMLTQLGERRRGHPVWLRVNPGFGHGHNKKTNTGGESSKHGIWHETLDDAFARIEAYDLDLVGLHMHIGSGADIEHLRRVCDAMVAEVAHLKAAGRDLRAISAGGGLPVPYRQGDPELDHVAHFRLWNDARQRIEGLLGHPVTLEIEPGRYLVAPAGVLVSEVRAIKDVGANHFTLVDAGFNDLMRPTLYGAYHEISVIPRQGSLAGRRTRPSIVAGPLCESGDVFTQDSSGNVTPRMFPEASVGDLLVFGDAGAYGASMGSNYNSRPLSPEVLVDGSEIRLIRRRQRIDELLSLEET